MICQHRWNLIKLRYVIAPEFQPDAIAILNLAGKAWWDKYIDAFDRGEFNGCCCVIDFAKVKLVHDGIIKEGDYPSFGEYLFALENELY
jgi:hypothetical protein